MILKHKEMLMQDKLLAEPKLGCAHFLALWCQTGSIFSWWNWLRIGNFWQIKSLNCTSIFIWCKVGISFHWRDLPQITIWFDSYFDNAERKFKSDWFTILIRVVEKIVKLTQNSTKISQNLSITFFGWTRNKPWSEHCMQTINYCIYNLKPHINRNF